MTGTGLVLVHGLFTDRRADPPADVVGARARRAAAVGEHGDVLGVRHYRWADGRGRRVANHLARIVRGTARAVDAVEVIEFDDATIRTALGDPSGRERLREMSGCAPFGFDPGRSFVLMGAPHVLVEGPSSGQHILWFGYGSRELDEAEFVEHYTHRHGPLVAGHATLLGLHRYLQVPHEQPALCESLHGLGFGQGPPPPVFAELFIGRSPHDLASLRARLPATREIRIDEKRHIDFRRSMLLVA